MKQWEMSPGQVENLGSPRTIHVATDIHTEESEGSRLVLLPLLVVPKTDK